MSSMSRRPRLDQLRNLTMRRNSSSTLISPSVRPSPKLPVLIAGAGLGGLALANSLSRSNIPYHVLERDADLHGRAQGYRFSLEGGKGDGGADGLRAVLSAERFAFFERSCGAEKGISGRVDAKSGVTQARGVWGMVSTGGRGVFWALLSRVLGRYWNGGRGLANLLTGFWAASTASANLDLPVLKQTSYQVDRRVLRSILLGPEIAPHVTYDAAVVSYTLHPDSVEAHLANGRSIHGSLLVGADGIRSHVASQLLRRPSEPTGDDKQSASKTIDLNVRCLYGKAPLTSKLLEKLQADLHERMAFVVDSTFLPPSERIMIVVVPMRFDRSISAEDKAAVGMESVNVPEDYVFFAMVGRKEIWHTAMRSSSTTKSSSSADDEQLDQELVRMTGTACKELSIDMARQRGWHPSTLALLEMQDDKETAVLKIRSSDTSGPPVWETSDRVTVLGDAIHCMPPTGGNGANTALWDAAVLGKLLAEEMAARADTAVEVQGQRGPEGEKGEDWKWSTKTIRRYEDAMRKNAGDIVGLACIGATYLFGGEEVWRS